MNKLLNLSIALLLCYFVHPAQTDTKAICLSESCAKQLLETADVVFRQHATAYRRLPNSFYSPELVLGERVKAAFMENMQKFDWQNFQDPLLKRQFEVLLRDKPIPFTDLHFVINTDLVQSAGKYKFACPRELPPSAEVCHLSFLKDIKPIITNSNDVSEIKWYWTEWRNKLPTQVKDGLRFFIKYWKGLATPEKLASAAWYSGYEDGDFLQELGNVMETIRPFYSQLHAQLRQALREKYGENIIGANGLIPHHLMEQTMYQAWKKDSLLKNPYPNKKLPNLQQELKGLHYKPIDLIKISAQFFGSLGFGPSGFDNLSDHFIREHFKVKGSVESGPDCKSRIITYGEIEMNYCPKVNYKKLLTTHGDVAQIEYAVLKNKLNVGLSQEACPGFGNAFGEAVILSVSTPKHLQQKLGLLLDYDYDEEMNLNLLYRMAVHALLTVPFYFVHEKLWTDMIDNKIEENEYNCHYWNLMEKYMGVERSAETSPDTFDMPYKFYEGLFDQTRSTKKLFGEFLGYQIYRDICLQAGQYQPANANKTLHNCDFAYSEQAGEILRTMMSAGSTKPWRETIKSLTKEQSTNLTGSAFLEYYEPLHTWLKNNNQNLQVGWQTNNNCRA